MTFELPIESVPSLNKLLNWHWSKRARLKKNIFAWLRIATGEPLPFAKRKIKRRCSVMITVIHRTRRFDPDNLHGAVKLLVDVLKESGLIYQDSPRWLFLALDQKVVRDDPRVIVTIQEVKYERNPESP